MAIYDPQGEWIFTEQGVALVLDLYKTSEGHAKAVVRTAKDSGEIGNPDHAMIGIPANLTGIPFSRADFLDWLERNPPGKRAAIKKGRRYISAADIPGTVSEYLASATAPSMAGLVHHAKELGLDIPRSRLRDAYRKQRRDLRRGRPPKIIGQK